MKPFIFMDTFFTKQSHILYIICDNYDSSYKATVQCKHIETPIRLNATEYENLISGLKGFCHYKTKTGEIWINKRKLAGGMCHPGSERYYLYFSWCGKTHKLQVEANTFRKIYVDWEAKYQHELEKDKAWDKAKKFMKMTQIDDEQKAELLKHIEYLTAKNDKSYDKLIKMLEDKLKELSK